MQLHQACCLHILRLLVLQLQQPLVHSLRAELLLLNRCAGNSPGCCCGCPSGVCCLRAVQRSQQAARGCRLCLQGRLGGACNAGVEEGGRHVWAE